MSVYRCPECGNEVVLSKRAEERTGRMDMGCNNHDEAIVMWKDEAREG